jgi:hypothetical protein
MWRDNMSSMTQYLVVIVSDIAKWLLRLHAFDGRKLNWTTQYVCRQYEMFLEEKILYEAKYSNVFMSNITKC